MGQYCLGIDLGGTMIKFAALDADNRPSRMIELPTPDGAEAVVEQMLCGAGQVVDELGEGPESVTAVGIGAPGPLDLSAGVVRAMPNLPGMENVPLRDRIADGLRLPAVLENDANAAAYGEYLCGAGRGCRGMVLLTLGTGIGSGIVIDGEVFHGAHEIGAELGHMIVEAGGEACGCGQRGCWERYASATYLAAHAERRVKDEAATGQLAEVLETEGRLTAKDVEDACRAGDPLGKEVWARTTYYLAVGCVNICRIFDPDKIVLAGGLTNAGDALLEPLRERFRELHWSLTEPVTEIVLTELGERAGVIGAAGVAWRRFGG